MFVLALSAHEKLKLILLLCDSHHYTNLYDYDFDYDYEMLLLRHKEIQYYMS